MREKLLRILNETCPGVDYENETALVDDGYLESLDVVTVVTEIMDAFNIRLSIEDLLPEHFNSVDAMLELISSARK